MASGIKEIEQTLLARELPAFQRLDERVRAWSGKSGGMPFDHSAYPMLIALSQTLARRDGAPAETKEAALGWLGRDADWKEARTDRENEPDARRDQHEQTQQENGIEIDD